MKRVLFGLLTCLLALSYSTNRAGTAGQHPTGVGPSFKGPIGLQLYSLREQLAKDVPATLDQVRSFGISYVETHDTYGLTPVRFRAELASRGLKAISGHFGYERCRDDIEGIARDAKTLGLQYVGCAWIPHQGDFDEKTCRETAAVFNRAGEVLAAHGLKAGDAQMLEPAADVTVTPWRRVTGGA